MNELRCPCGESVSHDHGGSVGAAAAATGFTPVMNSMGGTHWLCPACVAEIRPHVEEINRILPDEFLNWYALQCALKKGPHGL